MISSQPNTGPPLSAELAGLRHPTSKNRRRFRLLTASNTQSRYSGRQVRGLVAINHALPPYVWDRLQKTLREGQP